MSEKITLARYRQGDYIVNYNHDGRMMSYKWAGSKPKRIDKKQVPVYVVDWLSMNTKALTNGELVIVEDEKDEVAKEIKENIKAENTEIEHNTHTREELAKLVNGKLTKKTKDTLSKITNEDELAFLVQVAREEKVDTMSMRKFIADLVGSTPEMIFELNTEE